MNLTSIVKECSDRVRNFKDITALTGGRSGVDSIVVTNGGSGYTSAPTVGFTGGGGAGAAGTAVVVGGIVQSITITNKGTGYTSVPTVGFTGGGGTGAAGTALMSAQDLDAIKTTTLQVTPAGTIGIIDLSGTLSIYELVAGTDATASPTVIRPADYDGATNQKVWKLKTLQDATAGKSVSLNFVIDGGGVVITTGLKGFIEIAFAMTITGVTLLADASGSAVVDLYKSAYSAFPPGVGQSITAAAKPTLTAAQKSQDLTLTGWTTAVAAGDIIGFNVDSCATIQRLTVAIRGTKV